MMAAGNGMMAGGMGMPNGMGGGMMGGGMMGMPNGMGAMGGGMGMSGTMNAAFMPVNPMPMGGMAGGMGGMAMPPPPAPPADVFSSGLYASTGEGTPAFPCRSACAWAAPCSQRRVLRPACHQCHRQWPHQAAQTCRGIWLACIRA